MAEHDHVWASVGKRWSVCQVKGCGRVRLELAAEFCIYDTDTDMVKTVAVEFDGTVEIEEPSR